MKKLLSLLSVLTISGSAIPTTIAASPYQKEETIKNNDVFEKWYKFLEHDELKLKLSSDTAFKIIYQFEPDSKAEFLNQTMVLISNLPKSDHSGAGSSINKKDIKIMTNFIWEHFSEFHEIWKNLKQEQSIIIKTNTIGYWDSENPNNSIYLN
ncbi:hypothetical protein [Spiroplasma endosymbiont of Megaselia nigra]|uniref:hypothetical protein n=1 Tax=Spiroplasma endosymbiont of Megaselia nigra TaxID=2478537 RepID=UPI000F87BF92|nr:hypothetical protein [Spiroplasma endosymbiont of Megaselia nigra]RUO86362.1 hypothetical protein D9R21_03480 [Spiroplasma endosymbiont of Megaselia nigra]